MNPLKSIYIKTLIVSVALFAMGQVLFVRAFGIFEPQVDGILFQIIERKAIIKTSVLFSFSLALIPVLIVVVWQQANITSVYKKLASALMVLCFIFIGIFARHQQVKLYFITVVKPALLTNASKSISYPIDPVNFVYYIFGGLFIGCIISYILFKNKRLQI